MKFSEEFEQRFSTMLTHYPTKRSVLVPTLLYAQDEVGFLSDEVILEIAGAPGSDRTRCAQRDQLLFDADDQAAWKI
jgi:NADH:ubiquinone oxidoreductase subunit E